MFNVARLIRSVTSELRYLRDCANMIFDLSKTEQRVALSDLLLNRESGRSRRKLG